MADVSIILVSYNTKEFTKNCLKSIFEKTTDVDFDVYVVDNNSIDGTCEMIKSDFPEVHLIENKENLGFGNANNLAINVSESKYLFLLNTDTSLINNAVKILYDFMEQHPEAGACGGNLYNKEGNNVHSYGYFPTLKSEIIRLFNLGMFFPDEQLKIKDNGENLQNLKKEVDIIIGADLFLRKSVIDNVGGFDKDFFLYDEESELQYRIKKSGYKIYIIPESKIYHFEGKSTKDRLSTRRFKMISKILFFKKCYGKKELSLFKFIYYLSNSYRIIEHPIATFKTFAEIGKI